VPSAQLAQTGTLGSATYLFVRGGNFDENKVLIDGIPVNDIGGSVDFANIGSGAIARVEVFRGPNSALFGSDAMASVVEMRTRRGTTLAPQLSYSIAGGNFGTLRQEANVAGAWRRLDYFSDFTRIDSRNSEPNSAFHNGTYSGNFGWNLLSNTDARVTVWRSVSVFNSANALAVFGIPDDAWNRSANLQIGATIESNTTQRWHNLLRYGATRLRYLYTDPTPSGIPYDPFGMGSPLVYLGAPVTLRGANGYSASGQAIFAFAGIYPSISAYLTNRDFVFAQSDFTVNPHLSFLGGFRYENERGYTAYTGASKSETDRGNYSYIMQIAGSFWNRAYYSLGSSIEDNAVFGVDAAPRASLAWYLIRPKSDGWLTGTRLRFNFGKGVKEPSIFYEANSLYRLLRAQPNGLALIRQYGVSPIGPQHSRSYDGGVDQQLWGGRARLGVTFFHNEFANEVQYVPSQFLPLVGISDALIAQANQFGAAVNSLAFRAQGVETELEYRWRNLAIRGGWTYLDSVVQRSFSSSALQPVTNPLFPQILIGAYSPLVGARPFRRAPHTGYVVADWSAPRWTVSVSGTFVGRRDDSTYASDANFGSTLLLPNRNLLGGYQRIDLTASYRVNPVLSLIAGAQNLLSQHYQEAFGYPSLPFTFQSGIRLTVGGESWRKK
jgi:iron complex outermembrane receptor protein/vitamin B12 transporter